MKLTVLKNNVPINEVLVETPDFNERYEIYVGRSDDCHVQINDPLISRQHFVLKNNNGSWTCEKKSQLGSVAVNGQTGSSVPVHDQDEIKCGIYSVLVAGIAPTSRDQSAPIISKPSIETSVSLELDDSLLSQDEDLLAETSLDLSAEALSITSDDNLNPSETDNLSLDSGAEAQTYSSNDDQMSVDSFDDRSMSSDSEDNQLVSEFGSSETPEATGLGFSQEESSSEDDYSAGALSSPDMTGTRFDRNFINYQLILFGEHAPYDRFLMTEVETFIGRDNKKCQIILNDPEVSTVHAVLRKTGSEVTLEDLNSSNGTILNGERINRAQISTGDEFVIGGTSFTLEVRSELLDSESDRLMPVESGQFIETEEIEEEEVSLEDSDDFQTGSPEKSIIKRVWKDPAKRKILIYTLVGLSMLWLLFPQDESNTDLAETKKTKVATTAPVGKQKAPLSKELESRRNVAYELGFDYFNQERFNDALREFQIVSEIDPDYKKVRTFLEQTKTSLKGLEQLDAERRAAEEKIKTKKIIDDLMAKARTAVEERQVTVAESYFAQITEKDPENFEIQQLKMELEAWQKEEERKRLEQAAKDAARKTMVDALAPGKTYYLKKEWYRAILKLEEFLRKKGMDEDLVKEGSDMLSDAKNQLASELGPVLGKARSLKEGQDLKAAYESFLEVLKLEPTNNEALNEVDDIRNQLDSRSKRIYREAIIAESLSLFADAKEKYQEVQQISPTDSEYYRKATEKLRNYLE